jgi:hypothetical protein
VTDISPLASAKLKCLGLKQGKYGARRHPVLAVVIHFTGVGVWQRWKERNMDKYASETVALTAIRRYSTVYDKCGHYVVSQCGTITNMCPENYSAQHVGSSKWRRYENKWWCTEGLKWWQDRWAPHKSPIDLAGGKLWSKYSVNAVSVGIEVTPHEVNPTAKFSPACVKSLRALTKDICARYNIPWTKEYVIFHCDAHPIARTAKSKPYDVLEHQLSAEELFSDAEKP